MTELDVSLTLWSHYGSLYLQLWQFLSAVMLGYLAFVFTDVYSALPMSGKITLFLALAIFLFSAADWIYRTNEVRLNLRGGLLDSIAALEGTALDNLRFYLVSQSKLLLLLTALNLIILAIAGIRIYTTRRRR